ncbi:MAG: hypothetical protein OEY49_12770, partial [Candidatus Heimdallarchaeota archaeon]|nr:hypothetical protein [Candidatus Heimdallarchaeota archaeon]
ESTTLQARFDDEKRALEIIANTKLGDGLSMEKVMSELRKNTASSDEVVRLQNKINELEIKIKMEREENEKIQMELSTSFMEKITRYDEMIENLKSRLGEE